MAENTKIEWCDHTANLWHGCTKVHRGCDNCYAEAWSKRWKREIWGNDRPRLMIESVWKDLAKYQRNAQVAGEIKTVFVGSMMDIFEKNMPLIGTVDVNDGSMIGNEFLREELFTKIDAGEFPNLMFLLLTKRPSNINKMIPGGWLYNPPNNVMFGTSPVDQETADKLIPQLLQVNGHRFLSIEPQLGPVVIKYPWVKGGINWIIQGGESGHHKRPFNLEWAYDMREQCEGAAIPYFFKQIDKIQPVPEDLLTSRQFPPFKQFIYETV